MKEAKKAFCDKCGTYFYTHTHHTLPKAIFGKDVPTVELCPNCHTHFHEYSKKQTTDPKNREEAEKIWNYWFKHIAVIVTMIVLAILAGLYLLDYQGITHFLSFISSFQNK